MDYIEILREQLQLMARGLVAALPSIAIALAVLFLTWIIAKFAAKIADRMTDRTSMRASLQNLVETLVKLAIWIVGLLIALTIMLPGLTPASLIAGLGLGTLAIGFAFQDIFENFLAGVLIMLREKMRIGDLIEVEGIKGRVETITLRETHIRQLSNELTIVPNATLFKNPVQILTDEPIRRDEITVGVSYDTDLDQAMEVIRGAFGNVTHLAPNKPISVFAWSYGASSVDFLVQWWSEATPRDMRETRSEVVRSIKRALDDAGIEIPFPYVTHTFKEKVPLGEKVGEPAGD